MKRTFLLRQARGRFQLFAADSICYTLATLPAVVLLDESFLLKNEKVWH